MADINFDCPHCGQNLNGPEDMAGQTIDCPVCQKAFQIPGGIIEHQRTSFIDNRALANIEPSTYDGKVVLYRADRMHDGAIELDPQWAKIDPDGGWGPIVPDLEIVHIGGDHLSMVDEPYISTIGADLTTRLRGLGKN